VLAGTAAALLIAGLSGKKHNDQNATSPGVPSGAEIPLANADTFDPDGDPVGEENNGLVQRAIDSSESTFWPTETYQNSAVISESVGKPGVGLIVDAGKTVDARTMEVLTTADGWKADVYGSASSAPPTSLDGWGEPVGQVEDGSTDQQIQLNETSASQYFLIWFTRVSTEATQSSLGGFGGYNVQIKDVKLFS
jgi:hypothetical protein